MYYPLFSKRPDELIDSFILFWRNFCGNILIIGIYLIKSNRSFGISFAKKVEQLTMNWELYD